MYNSLEVFAIILIIVIQVIIAFRAYNQINQLNSFLPDGRSSLELKEYEIPTDNVLELEPFQIIDKITYLVKNSNSSKKESDEEVQIEEQSEQKNENAIIV